MAPTDDAAAAKAQAFAHRLVEFADVPACVKFFEEHGVDFDRPNDAGWSVLMSACACGRDDLAGLVLDRTANVRCATATNRTTALHLAAISANSLVMQELLATPERQEKLRPIADMPNINGDTPLMMACVAKNDTAARLLVELLGADPAYGNATGMNALMCAARLSIDASMDAAVQTELMRRSSTVVELLLARNVPANITELAAGNSALHFAVMSNNHAVVKRLVAVGAGADVSCKNKAGLTALELAKRTNVHPEILSQLQASWDAMETELAQQRAHIEEELVALGMGETKSNKPEGNKPKSKHARKSKRENSGRKHPDKKEIEAVPPTEDATHNDQHDNETAHDKEPGVIEPAEAEPSVMAAATNLSDAADEDPSEWCSVSAKKTRHKASAQSAKTPTRSTTAASPAAPRSKSSKSNRASESANQVTPTRLNRPAPSPPALHEVVPKATGAPKHQVDETQRRKSSQAARLSETSQPQAVENRVRLYEQLNAAFHHAYPMAGELELGVETFLIGSSAADRDLQPDDGLSISQVEVLQEAHWQAYHYLNEKKLDLARVLEAQRVEAQFALQQEILHLE